MHEVAVALGMVDELREIARKNKAKKILAIKLKIGIRSGIVTDSLKFAFDAVKLDHPFISSAEVTIDEIALIYRCNDCGFSFEAENIFFPSCQKCSSFNLIIVSGEEQHIEKVEIEV